MNARLTVERLEDMVFMTRNVVVLDFSPRGSRSFEDAYLSQPPGSKHVLLDSDGDGIITTIDVTVGRDKIVERTRELFLPFSTPKHRVSVRPVDGTSSKLVNIGQKSKSVQVFACLIGGEAVAPFSDVYGQADNIPAPRRNLEGFSRVFVDAMTRDATFATPEVFLREVAETAVHEIMHLLGNAHPFGSDQFAAGTSDIMAAASNTVPDEIVDRWRYVEYLDLQSGLFVGFGYQNPLVETRRSFRGEKDMAVTI